MSELSAEHRLLVARARLGDDRSFDQLVRVYTPRLMRFVRKLDLSETTSEDVIQESWLVAWSSLGRLRKVESFRGWLFGIVRYKSLQHMAKTPDVISSHLDLAGEVPKETFYDLHHPNLNGALDRVSVIHREVLVLRFFEEMSYEELTEVLGVTMGSIKSRLHNAKSAMRRALEDLCDE